MKTMKIFLVLVLSVCLLCGCRNNSITKKQEINRKPTLNEIAESISKYGFTIEPMINAVSSNIADLEKMDFNAITSFMLKYYEIYGNYDLVENQPTTYTNAAEMALLASGAYTKKEKFSGPILLVKDAKLTYNDGTSKSVNVLFLNGTDLSFSSIIIPDPKTAAENASKTPNESAIGFLEYIQAAMGLTNEYTYDSYYVLHNYREQLVKSGKISTNEKPDLIIVGLSLGGLIAQQLASLDAVQEQYNVLNVVTYGAPIIAQHDIAKTTKVQRMVDSVDAIPKLSVYQYDHGINGFNSNYNNNNAVVKTGIFETFLGSHTLSYSMDSVWGNVDVLGFENGGATLTFTYDKQGTQMNWYSAPQFAKTMTQINENN